MRRTILMVVGTTFLAFWLRVPFGATQEPESGTPNVRNARVQTRTISGTVGVEVKKWAEQGSGPQWLGYAVPEVSGHRTMCCGNYEGSARGERACRLEKGGDENSVTVGGREVKLEGPRDVVVLFRVENRKIGKIRVVSEDCVLDAGGVSFTWLKGVKPAESVEFLTGFVRGVDFDSGEAERTNHSALTAVAMHADAAADRALESFIAGDQRESLRKQAAFWLGEARGEAGLVALEKMAKSDASSDMRAQVAFCVFCQPGAGSDRRHDSYGARR
jgi:hypothetical protein